MSHTPHELAADFPDHAEAIHDLKTRNADFALMAERYHTLNRAIHRAETDIEPTSDDHMTEMRRERMALKDRIWGALREAAG